LVDGRSIGGSIEKKRSGSSKGEGRKIKKIKPKTFHEVLKGIRRDWGGINPTTKVIEDKTKYNRAKEKQAVKSALKEDSSPRPFGG